MPTNQRYHIHICLVRNEHPEFENALQQALSDDYFLTWDLIAHPSNFMEYSRQQIDRCDYCLFILGNGYGHLSPSGVSFLHLSYIYAVTKRKPMLALIKNRVGNVHFTRQRIDLATMIQKELSDNVVLFDLTQVAVNNGLMALKQLIQQNPVSGWQRGGQVSTTNFGKINNFDTILQPKPVVPSTDYQNTTLLFNASTPSKSPQIDSPIEISLEDTVLVNYSAHAYQDGNLQDILAAHTFRWSEIVTLLKQVTQPFSSDTMLKYLNDSLKDVALEEASKVMPNVHAVSRCQVTTVDFQWIKKQLINKGWLVKDASSRGGRELWRTHPSL